MELSRISDWGPMAPERRRQLVLAALAVTLLAGDRDDVAGRRPPRRRRRRGQGAGKPQPRADTGQGAAPRRRAARRASRGAEQRSTEARAGGAESVPVQAEGAAASAAARSAPCAPPHAVVPAGPPPPPPWAPIALKFFGLVVAPAHGEQLAILSDGRNAPFYGKEGAIIEGRYRILKIGVESVELAYADGRGRQTIRLTGS